MGSKNIFLQMRGVDMTSKFKKCKMLLILSAFKELYNANVLFYFICFTICSKIHGFRNTSPKFHRFRGTHGTHANAATAVQVINIASHTYEEFVMFSFSAWRSFEFLNWRTSHHRSGFEQCRCLLILIALSMSINHGLDLLSSNFHDKCTVGHLKSLEPFAYNFLHN